MPGIGVEGPFSQENEESDAPEMGLVGAPRPAHCRKFARQQFAEALPAVMRKLLNEVLAGSVPHLKMVVELAGLDKPDPPPRQRKPKERTLEAILIEQWRKDEEEEVVRREAREKMELDDAAEERAIARAEELLRLAGWQREQGRS